MLYRAISGALLIAGIAACAPSQAEMQQTAAALEQSCNDQVPSGLPDTQRRRTACFNEASTTELVRHGYPHMDLVNLANAHRYSLAEQVDMGLITEAQAKLSMAEMAARITSEARTRDTATAQAEAASWAQIQQGLALMNQANQSPPRQGFTCTQMGNTTNCW